MNHLCSKNKSVIRFSKIFTGCDKCLDSLIQGNENAARYNRERMKRDFEKDLVQPIEPRKYINAYGVEAARKHYTDEFIRDNS